MNITYNTHYNTKFVDKSGIYHWDLVDILQARFEKVYDYYF